MRRIASKTSRGSSCFVFWGSVMVSGSLCLCGFFARGVAQGLCEKRSRLGSPRQWHNSSSAILHFCRHTPAFLVIPRGVCSAVDGVDESRALKKVLLLQ